MYFSTLLKVDAVSQMDVSARYSLFKVYSAMKHAALFCRRLMSRYSYIVRSFAKAVRRAGDSLTIRPP